MRALLPIVLALASPTAVSALSVYLSEVPDYDWLYGCFGTATGNLMGYWDRHGMPNLYTGPVGGGLAPLDTRSSNYGVVSLWASDAHLSDYWIRYESAEADPFVQEGRPEHAPDCIGDFIGLNQNRWHNMAGECDGNIDGFSFVYWDSTGQRRVNYVPSTDAGTPARDIPSGLRAWTLSRGYDCEVFTQLTDFNPAHPLGQGFTFEDLKAEIDAGYPVLLFLQDFDQMSRPVGDIEHANPNIHGVIAFGYYTDDQGLQKVRFRDSWGSGRIWFGDWSAAPWTNLISYLQLSVRGVIGFHPRPKITRIRLEDGQLALDWDGPSPKRVEVFGSLSTTNLVSGFQIEHSESLSPARFTPISEVTTERTASLPAPVSPGFFRVRLVKLPPPPQ